MGLDPPADPPPGKLTYAELAERTTAFASAIKAVAPAALVFGPVSYGWHGFVTLQDAPDRDGRDFLDYYLDSLRDAEAATGGAWSTCSTCTGTPRRGAAACASPTTNTSAAVAAARVQAPRSLWDPSYTENSWISIDARVGPIRLLPRMREKIAAHYPGTRLAITEYNYGGGDHISGAIAQADVLGIFGREDVFAAALWDLGRRDAVHRRRPSPPTATTTARAGASATPRVGAATSNHETTSVYASVDASGEDRIVLVAVNKSTGKTTAEILITHGVSLTRGQTWQITQASPMPVPGPALTATSRNAFRLEMPAIERDDRGVDALAAAVSERGGYPGWQHLEQRARVGFRPALLHPADADLDRLLVLQQVDEPLRVRVPEVVGVEDPRLEGARGVGHHLRRHRVRQVHRQEGHRDPGERLHLGDVLGIARHVHASLRRRPAGSRCPGPAGGTGCRRAACGRDCRRGPPSP